MASIILKPHKSLDLEKVYEQVVTSLPAYAYPRFLRIQVILLFSYHKILRPGNHEGLLWQNNMISVICIFKLY